MTNMIHSYEFYSHNFIILESYTLVSEKDGWKRKFFNIKTRTSIIVDKFDQLLPQVLPSSDKESNMIKLNLFRLNLSCCSEVTIPTEKSNETVKRKLKEQIDNARYNSGIPIIPQKFEKALVKDNEIITEEIVIEGRKISLRDIRIKNAERSLKVYADIFGGRKS